MRLTLTLPVVTVLALVACGGDSGGDGDGDGDIDASTIDAPAACPTRAVDEMLGTISNASFGAVATEQSMTNPNMQLLLFATIDGVAPAPTDVFEIRLFQGETVFDPDFVTGTFDLTGAETDYYSCGACVHILGDFESGSGGAAQDLVASSGTLTLDAVSVVDGETVSGTVTNAVLRQVILDDGGETQSAVPGGCETTIDSIPFSATVQALRAGDNLATGRPRSARRGSELLRQSR